MKRKNITNTQQEVAVDILTELGFCENMEEVYKLYRDIYEKYELNDDPFTNLPCTNKDYSKNSTEYDKQIMYERYGHCDGLE